MVFQAADRRDRLIYVLSQINAARGDDAMQVDDDSSEDSEDEVRSLLRLSVSSPYAHPLAGGRILLPWYTRAAGGTKTDSRILSP